MDINASWPFEETKPVVHSRVFKGYGANATQRDRLDELCLKWAYAGRPDDALSPKDYINVFVESFDSNWSNPKDFEALRHLVKAMEEDKGIKLTLCIDSATCPPRSGISLPGRSPETTTISRPETPKEVKPSAHNCGKGDVFTPSAEGKPTEADTERESGEQMRHRPTTFVYLSLLTAVVLTGLIAPLIIPTIPYYWWSFVYGILGALFGALGAGGVKTQGKIKGVMWIAWGAIGGLVLGALIPVIVALVGK